MKVANITPLFQSYPDVMTVSEVAKTVRCSDSYILDLLHKDVIACFLVGRQYRLLKADVIAYMQDLERRRLPGKHNDVPPWPRSPLGGDEQHKR